MAEAAAPEAPPDSGAAADAAGTAAAAVTASAPDPQAIRAALLEQTYAVGKPRKRILREAFRPNYSLTTADVNSVPRQRVSQRHTNPNDPEYMLPTFTYQPPDPPPLHRDTLQAADVNTTRYSRKEIRRGVEYLDYSDVVGSSPRKLAQGTGDSRSLATGDIPGAFAAERTVRGTNPLEPSYKSLGP
eukprot:RCo009171